MSHRFTRVVTRVAFIVAGLFGGWLVLKHMHATYTTEIMFSIMALLVLVLIAWASTLYGMIFRTQWRWSRAIIKLFGLAGLAGTIWLIITYPGPFLDIVKMIKTAWSTACALAVLAVVVGFVLATLIPKIGSGRPRVRKARRPRRATRSVRRTRMSIMSGVRQAFSEAFSHNYQKSRKVQPSRSSARPASSARRATHGSARRH